MYLSNQSLLVIVVVGIVAGWLAGKVVEGGGFGLIWDLIIGLIGAFIGDWLLPQLLRHRYRGIDYQCLHWRCRVAANFASRQRLARWMAAAVVNRAP
jgi:uncharacterized membrane protein YeaQ/YmgE (transglycosylase-associated protein family)